LPQCEIRRFNALMRITVPSQKHFPTLELRGDICF
jgi:hypothetical protein